jgi:hypothetical protein
MSKKYSKKRNRAKTQLFSPDAIVTAVRQAVCRDLAPLLQEEVGDEGLKSFVADTQVQKLLKKYVSEDQDEATLAAATFDKFMKVNAHMADFVDIDVPDPSWRKCCQSTMCDRTKILYRARALMHWVLSGFDEEELIQSLKHGSGSSIGVNFVDTSMESKFTFPMSVTEEAKPWFDHLFECDFELRLAVEDFNRRFPSRERTVIVPGSRATTVDKDDEIRRLIAVEPTANMYMQQALMTMMYRRMKIVNLDVETLPDEHKERAWEASITGRYATIDWTSASDCVSIGLLRWLLPKQWFRAVSHVRSPLMTLNGQQVDLNMFSTMGNAVTFPLETLVFWTMAQACRLTFEEPSNNSLYPEWDDLKQCSVFGDDCIVPTWLAPQYIEVMTEYGMIVNDKKSFYDPTDPFRESCGGDYLSGYNVRPYYLKAPTSTSLSALEPWLYVMLNSLVKKYISYFGELTYVYDKAAFAVIAELFRTHGLRVKIVPDYLPDDAGLKASGDAERLCQHYQLPMDWLSVDKHGTVTFRYCRFRYRNPEKRSDDLRYVVWKKHAWNEQQELLKLQYPTWWESLPPFELHPLDLPGYIREHVRTKRKVGGYVVASGLTSHWTPPPLVGAAR